MSYCHYKYFSPVHMFPILQINKMIIFCKSVIEEHCFLFIVPQKHPDSVLTFQLRPLLLIPHARQLQKVLPLVPRPLLGQSTSRDVLTMLQAIPVFSYVISIKYCTCTIKHFLPQLRLRTARKYKQLSFESLHHHIS